MMNTLRRASAAVALVGVLALNPVGAPTAQAAPAPVSSLTSSSCPSLIKQGQVSGCVTRLQTLLNANGARLTVDGNFGPATRTAVMNFQAKVGLAKDGVVGPRTKAALEATATRPAPAPTKTTTKPAPKPTTRPTTPTGSTQSKILAHARALVAGQAQPGWKGGKIPYVWGGGHKGNPGPSTGTCQGYSGPKPCRATTTVGLDCSGFTRYVYSLAYGRDVLGSGNTDHQKAKMRRVSTPQPGDLVFWGPDKNTYHVAIYMGGGMIAEAPQTGLNLRIISLSKKGKPLGYYRLP